MTTGRARAPRPPKTAAITGEAGRNGAGILARLAAAPTTVAGSVAADLATAGRRPDAVAYFGGLAALAAIRVLEAPIAAAIGVGVAVAGGRAGS